MAEKRVRIVPQSFLDNRENERLIKLLLRCIKMFEAKQRTMKILMRAKNRDELKIAIMESIDDMDVNEIQTHYKSILKTSAKLYSQIETLRADFIQMNRPFMYQGQNLQTTIIKDQIDIRHHVLKSSHLVSKEMVSLVLDKKGRIVHISKIIEDTKKKIEEDMKQKLMRSLKQKQKNEKK